MKTQTFSEIANNLWKSGELIPSLLVILGTLIGIVTFITLLALVLIYCERKIAAHFQCRLGPMRVGWHGTLQAVADAIKLMNKEDITPDKADKFLHLLAPFLAMTATVLALIIIPFSPMIQVIDLNVGILYWAAVSGLGVLGVLLAGWASNNKWSLIGAMRAAAQLISYELSITLVLVVIVLLSNGSLRLTEIIASQESGWLIFKGHIVSFVAFIIFFIASLAELNRTPFDLPEGESELGAGFHTEYSGLKFSFFFLAEFINMFVVCAFMSTIFFGGWLPFQIGNFEAFNSLMNMIPPIVWFGAKTSFLIFIMMWIRWTFPRLRMDQLMRLEWKVLLPVGIINIVLAAVITTFGWVLF